MSQNSANDQRASGRRMVKIRRRRSMQPTLMTLEERRLLSTYSVTSTGDDVNTTGTLRWAVAQADAATSPSTIDFNLGDSPATITLSEGVLDLSNASDAITITGPGANLLSINGNKASGVFQVDGGVTVSLSGLTITGGSTQNFGAGLRNNGTVSLTGCTISDNSSLGANNKGGGLENTGTVTLTGCTISGNSSSEGGGLANLGGTANLINCTIIGNSGSSNGGGLWNRAALTLTGCTISGNSAPSGGGLKCYTSATFTDTIVAGNAGPNGPSDIGGGVVTGSNNLVGTGGSGGLTDGTDGNIILADLSALGLAPLDNYGGPTQTMALLPGSAALGKGTAVNGVTTDQRGEPLDSPNPDIGAFQSQGFSLTVDGGTGQSSPLGIAFADPLTVLINPNNANEPVVGGTVTFTVNPSAGGAAASLADSPAVIGADGTASVTATAISVIGSYTVVASTPGAGAQGDFSLTNTKGTPVVTVTDAGGTYNGSAFDATASVTGADGTSASSLEGETPALTYYAGSTATGTPLSGAPSSPGTYTVVANFAGSTDYDSAASSPGTFTITQATPGVTVTDAGGTYNGSAFPATAAVAGVSGTPSSSLEGVTPTVTYYAGSTASGTPLSGAPSAAGTYTVVANFAGSADYLTAASTPTTFTITQATPAVTVTDAGGTYNGSAFAASASVTGISGTPSASLEGVTPTVSYYAGSTASGTPLSGAPSAAGTYTVVANFASSSDYGVASSSSVTFAITQATPAVTVTDAGGTYNGSAFAASASTTGVSGHASSSLEGVTPALTYYAGSTATGTPLPGAPTSAGTYTVVGSFPGSTDYSTAASTPVIFTITQATPVVTVTEAGGTFNGSAFLATADIAGVNGSASASLEGVIPTLTYYSGTAASGTPLSGAPISAGTFTVIANFAGSADYIAAQSSPVTFTIGRASAQVALSSSAGSAVSGQSVSFVATVSAAGGTPTGTVTFSAGGNTLGTVTLDSSGTATLTTSGLALGSTAVTATYNGSTNLGTATSGSVSESVGKANSQIVLVPHAVRKGKKVVSVGLEADVTLVAPATGTLTGTVTFETMQKKKVKVLGTATLSGGKATLTLKANAVLKKTITLVYSGDANALTSTITPPALTQGSLKSLARPMIVFLRGDGHSHRHHHHAHA